MRSVTPMKTAKFGYIIVSVILCAIGILFIAMPQLSVSIIGIITGITLIVFGAVKLIGYFSKDLFRLAFQYDLAFGLLLIVLGAVVMLRSQNIINFLCVVIGIAILADGLFKIQIAFDSKSFGIKNWWLIFALAVAAGIIGGLLIFRPVESSGFLISLLGISLLFEGILNLCTAVFAVKIVQHQQPDVIEIEINEESET